MTSKVWVPGTVIDHNWLQDVDNAVYKAASSTDGSIPRTALDKFSEMVSIVDFGASPTIADNTSYINAACAAVGARGGGTVTIPYGVFRHASLIKVPANTSLIGSGWGTVLQCTRLIPTDGSIPGAAHQGQNVALVGDNSSTSNYTIDGGGFNTGGIVASGVSNFNIKSIKTINGGVTGCQSFQLFASKNFTVSYCDVEQNLHGFQINQCLHGQVFSNKTNKTASGLYTSGATDILVYGNSFRNCEDVCLDFEGGRDCYGFGNFVSGGYNAELAMFMDGTGSGIGSSNLILTKNIVHRTATFVNRAGASLPVRTDSDCGALWCASLSPTTVACGMVDNDVLVDYGAGFAWFISTQYGTDYQDFSIARNRFRYQGLGPMFIVTGSANGFKHTDNKYDIQQGITGTSIVKNMKSGDFSDNTFNCAAHPSVPLVKLYSDIAGQQTCPVSRNRFSPIVGDNALVVDQFNSGYGTYTLIDNTLTTTSTANGGLTVNNVNESPIYVNQTLLIAESDAANATITVDVGAISAINSATAALRPIADIRYVNSIGGVTRNLYVLMFMTGKIVSMNGTGSGSGVSASTGDYISGVSGSIVSITKSVGGSNRSMFKVTLNSVYK